MTDFSRLPGPALDQWEWQQQGTCRVLDTELFFHPDGERGPSRSGREASAKAVCRSCPVQRACREHALAVREPYGIWGGLSEQDREDLLGRTGLAIAV